MPKLTGSDLLNTEFTPSVGEFTVMCTGGQIQLEYQAGGAGLWFVAEVLLPGVSVAKQVAATDKWRFTAVPAGSAVGVTFQAAQ